jgi:proline racemase
MGPDLPYVPLWIHTEDWHTAGEPFRVVEYLPAGHLPQGVTVAERRFNVFATPLHPLDTLRQTLCHEPRGHADMYGGFIVPSNDSGAHFGVLFWHKDGFSTACGHGTIALGYWAVAKGLVEVPQKDCEVDVVVDAPSGRVKASVAVQDGKLVHADFVNVASRKLTDTIQLAVPSYRIDAHLQLSYGGAVYVSLNATQFASSVEPSNAGKFSQLARNIKDMLLKDERKLDGQGDIYGVIFWQDKGED